MANDVNRLIDMLYERIEDAKSPALKPNMSMVDRDEMLDLLDELRAQLPVEIKRAQELLTARDKFVEDAKRDVERMMRQAELDAKAKVSDSEVIYAAKEKARQIITRAEERSRQLYQVANEYAEDALARTEEAVQAALDEVNVSRYARYMKEHLSQNTQFIAITHRRGTMEEADVLYGVTMQDEGVSKLLTINVNDVYQKLKIG